MDTLTISCGDDNNTGSIRRRGRGIDYRLKHVNKSDLKTLDIMTHEYFDYFDKRINYIDENKLKSIGTPLFLQVFYIHFVS